MKKRSHRDFYHGISAFHHIDGDPTNDSLDNLILVNTRDHYEPDEDDTRTCGFCGDVMFNENGLPVCPSCGGDPDLDDECEDKEDAQELAIDVLECAICGLIEHVEEEESEDE